MISYEISGCCFTDDVATDVVLLLMEGWKMGGCQMIFTDLRVGIPAMACGELSKGPSSPGHSHYRKG